MNLIEKIQYCIEQNCDEYGKGFQIASAEEIEKYYYNLSEEKRFIIDNFCILLCGYELKSIINRKTIYEEEFDKVKEQQEEIG